MKGISILDRMPDNQLLAFDLADILRLVEPDVLRLKWELEDVECVGKGAEEFHRLSDEGTFVTGKELVDLASRIDQMIDGECRGYDEGSSTGPWIIIRAVDSSAVDIECKDQVVLERIREHFSKVVDMPTD